MGYRYRAASIEGDWTSPTFSEKMLATLKDTANTKNKVSNALPQGQNLITDINTAMSITDNKAHLKVSFVYNRKALYQAYQSRVTELKVSTVRSSRRFLIVIHCQKKTTINSLMRQ